MSEFINNREYRQGQLKELIKRLHDGASVDEVKEDFDKLSQGITAIEITEMEQALVNEGMPVEDIQRLCDVHASVFKGSIEEIHQEDGYSIPDFDEGHPIHTFKKENRIIEDFMDHNVLPSLSDYTEDMSEVKKNALVDNLTKLLTIDKHYSRKENLLFPYMEKYDITAPPKVMWGVDDEVRSMLKEVLSLLGADKVQLGQVNTIVRNAVNQINEMIFKEEEILFPMALETFSLEEWIAIEKASAEIGYTMLHAVKRWQVAAKSQSITSLPANEQSLDNQTSFIEGTIAKDSESLISFDAGSLSAKEVNAIMNVLPIDATFVDANDRVKYITQGKERIFDRPLTIIGREVKNCHPPKSVHIVEQIVADLKSGKKDNEDFWIKMGPMFVYIRYFAVRSKTGEFLGTLEVSQNIKPMMELEGEKRLRDEELK